MRLCALAAAILLLSNVALAAPVVEMRARVEPPYVVVHLLGRGFQAASATIDLGNFSRYLEYATAVINGTRSPLRVQGGKLSFGLTAGGGFELWLALNTTLRGAGVLYVSLPAPLVPVEARDCNFTLTVSDLPSYPSVVSSPFNVSVSYGGQRYSLRAALSVEAPRVGNLTFSVLATMLAPSIERLDRTLYVDAQHLTIVDNFTLVGFAGRSQGNVTLTYPGFVEVREVGGLLGPYPPTFYSVERQGDATVVSIRLLAPPEARGDRAIVWVKLSAPLSTVEGRYALPAFLSVGWYVSNLTITLKVRGELRGVERVGAEGGYTIYRLSGQKLLPEEADPYVLVEGHLYPPPTPNYLLIAALAVVLAAVGAVMRLRRPKGELVAAEVRVSSELLAVLRERGSNLEAYLGVWGSYRRGKLSRQALRQAAQRYMRREAELRRLAEVLASSEEARELLEKVDGIFAEVGRLLREAEEVVSGAGRRLSERERERRLSDIERKLRESLDDLHEVLKGY